MPNMKFESWIDFKSKLYKKLKKSYPFEKAKELWVSLSSSTPKSLEKQAG